MRLRYVAALLVLIVVVNAGVSYGIVQWASPSGAQGPQGKQGAQGPQGPVATADAKALACSALLANPANGLTREVYLGMISKYCP